MGQTESNGLMAAVCMPAEEIGDQQVLRIVRVPLTLPFNASLPRANNNDVLRRRLQRYPSSSCSSSSRSRRRSRSRRMFINVT